MFKYLVITLVFFVTSNAIAEDLSLQRIQDLVDTSSVVCSGISDEISRVAKISKVNTAVTAVGTVAAGGALVAGIKKSQEEEEIEKLVNEICAAGGCTADGINKMSNEVFLNNVLQPMAKISELQQRIQKSKRLGNWRTGLLGGTVGTNLVSAIMSGMNSNQSDLIQHISACNEVVNQIKAASAQLVNVDVNPLENANIRKLNNIKNHCGNIDTASVEKIEKRMKGVMGTSVAGVVIGTVGTITSASANSDKYMDINNKMTLTDEERNKQKNLNTTSNVMAGANVVTGAVETGLNVSLINLTKKLISQAQLCEEVLR